MEEGMYICLCNGITDRQIKHYINLGVKSIQELQKYIFICDTCFTCEMDIQAMFDERDKQVDIK